MGTGLGRLRQRLATGEWVSTDRLVAYPVMILLACAGVGVVAIALGSGLRDGLAHEPLGSDFITFHAASELLLTSRPEMAYDLEALVAVQRETMGGDVGLYAWLYPPTGFLAIAPLAALPYIPSLVAWLAITGVPYLALLRRIVPHRRAMLAIVAYPAVFITVGHGQNAMLSAALFGWGLVMLDRRPWLAGGLLGLLVFKPQLGLLLPVALLAARRWRVVAAASLSGIVAISASYLLTGAPAWRAWMEHSGFAVEVLEQGIIPWTKMASTFAGLRLMGVSVAGAWFLQGVVALGVAVATWLLWRGRSARWPRVAGLSVGVFLATPFAYDYEATFLGIAIAAMVAHGLEHGFLSWEKTVLAVAWFGPLVWRIVAMWTGLPLAVPTAMGLMVLVLRRWTRERAGTVWTRHPVTSVPAD